LLKPISNMNVRNIKDNERGAALAIVIIILAILAVIGMTALAFSSSEARIAGKDLQRTQTFYAAVAGIEKMSNDFSDLFRYKMAPTLTDLNNIRNNPPPGLITEGFQFNQTLEEDTVRLNELQTIQGLPANTYPRVNISNGPYAGLYASLIPYKMSSTALMTRTGTEVELEREFNNYLVPLFQFGIFSNEDIEFHPGPQMTFNGRVHSNQNIYALQNILFLERISAAGEFVRDVWRHGKQNNNNNIWVRVNGIDVQSTIGNGSVKAGSGLRGGPNFPGATLGMRGYFPGHQDGIPNPDWETVSVQQPVAGTPNRFGGQVLTSTTGATELKLPLQIKGNSTAELIKRSLPSDDGLLADSRYHKKAQIRILIDDWDAGSGSANVAGIPAGRGVLLKNDNTGFNPILLDGGNALRRVSDAGSYIDGATIKQKESAFVTSDAKTVRGIKSSPVTGTYYIPPGSGIQGKILIEVVKPDGTTLDVTQEILSMGMTVGEPNGIVYLQRPMWAAYVQGSRDRNGNGFNLVNLTRNYQHFADGEIITAPTFDTSIGLISMSPLTANEDSGVITREATATGYNSIYPISVYNVREGWYQSSMDKDDIYERGITSVIDLNMRNLARWLDGVYDSNLLAGTNAVSTNIGEDEGYVVYVSDRRGDTKKVEYLADGSNFVSTNGIVDNEDIYGPNNALDVGEDVIDFGWFGAGVSKKGTLQRDLNELPVTGFVFELSNFSSRLNRSMAVLQRPINYFRRGVRLFDGETLSFSATSGKLSPTKGITVATENMVYIWGNYNTTGITGIPASGSTLNDGGYTGPQIPASIVSDAFFPLSKTWFDGLSSMRPEARQGNNQYRQADVNTSSIAQSTTVRAGIIAGATLSRMNGWPGRNAGGEKLSGGIHNFPRFLEIWGGSTPWNYTGAFIPLYHSTQAVSQYEDGGIPIYSPPRRNWSFDSTFQTSNRLPPGTPFFQYIQPTGFRQKLR
jgi:type II secretory pathway pseudopilin PulG